MRAVIGGVTDDVFRRRAGSLRVLKNGREHQDRTKNNEYESFKMISFELFIDIDLRLAATSVISCQRKDRSRKPMVGGSIASI